MSTPATEQHLAQIFDNIDKDERLTEAEKVEARAQATGQIAALEHDSNLQPDIWTAHCSTQIALLETLPQSHPHSPGSRVGNIWGVRSFQNSVGFQLNCEQREAERIVQLACKAAADLDEDEAEELTEIYGNLSLRHNGDCWFFDGPESPGDPFAGLEHGALSCRLGLPYRVGESFVTFSLAPPEDTRRPCVLDADWYFQKFWRPGGQTRAFCSNCVEGGLSEWIAAPPLLIEAGGPISVAMVTDGNPIGADPYDVI